MSDSARERLMAHTLSDLRLALRPFSEPQWSGETTGRRIFFLMAAHRVRSAPGCLPPAIEPLAMSVWGQQRP
jgi:hypothetical protein